MYIFRDSNINSALKMMHKCTPCFAHSSLVLNKHIIRTRLRAAMYVFAFQSYNYRYVIQELNNVDCSPWMECIALRIVL